MQEWCLQRDSRRTRPCSPGSQGRRQPARRSHLLREPWQTAANPKGARHSEGGQSRVAHAPPRAAGKRSLMHELHVFVAFPGTAARRRPRPGRGQRGSRKIANRVLLVHQRGLREGLRWCSCRTCLLIFTGTAAGSPDWPGRGRGSGQAS